MPDLTPQDHERAQQAAWQFCLQGASHAAGGVCLQCQNIAKAVAAAAAEQRKPEWREYVIVPMGWDEGEIEGPGGPLEVQLMDLADDVTVVGLPRGLDDASRELLMEKFGAKAEPGKREFWLLTGPIPVDWQFVKLVPRDQYDPVLRERRPGT